MSTTSPHINDLRQHLLSTLASLRDRDNPMEPDRARAIAQVASVLVDSAKAETDYIKATGGVQDSSFLAGDTAPAISHQSATATGNALPTAHNPFPVTRHRIK